MIFVDTSAWIDYFNNVNASHTDNIDRLLQSTRIVTGDLVISELLRGFRDEKDYREARRLMDTLEYRDMVGIDIAIESADNYRFLRKKGLTVRKTIDTIIATFCIANDFELIHNDSDFDPFEEHLGLKVYR